jgi:hypothetical protein
VYGFTSKKTDRELNKLTRVEELGNGNWKIYEKICKNTGKRSDVKTSKSGGDNKIHKIRI